MFALGEAGATVARVVIVAPNPVVRAGVATLVDGEAGIQVAGTVPDVDGLEAMVRMARPDVLLADTALGEGVLGLVTSRAEERLPAVPIVALVTGEVPAVEDLIGYARAGVDGIVSTADDIAAGVMAICAGRAAGGWVSPTLGAAVLREGMAATTDPPSSPEPMGPRSLSGIVTPSEKAVLILVADGHTDREIANRLRRSERVVKYHVSNLLTKFQAKNRAHVVNLAVRAGVLLVDCSSGQGAIGQGLVVRTTRDGR